MTAANITLNAEQGASFSKTWRCRDEAGDPLDFTTYTARMQVRATYESAAALIDLTTENGGIVLGGTAGTIQVTIDETVLSAIAVPSTAPGQPPTLACVFDLELVNGGTIIRLFQGQFNISREVTR